MPVGSTVPSCSEKQTVEAALRTIWLLLKRLIWTHGEAHGLYVIPSLNER